jgi:lysozyme
MHISSRGLALIESFEGFSSAPYWDSYGRVWTRGYGETEGIGPDSPHLSRAEATTNLKRLVEDRYEWAIRELGVEFSQDQWDALCSFVWNLGAGIFTGDLRTALQAREWTRAAQLMLAYDHAGGQVLEGLARRRRQEVALFLSHANPVANSLSVLTEAERRLANSLLLYRQHPRLHAHGIRVTHQALVVKRKEVWAAADHEIKAGKRPVDAWAFRDRAARYKVLWSLTR